MVQEIRPDTFKDKPFTPQRCIQKTMNVHVFAVRQALVEAVTSSSGLQCSLGTSPFHHAKGRVPRLAHSAFRGRLRKQPETQQIKEKKF